MKQLLSLCSIFLFVLFSGHVASASAQLGYKNIATLAPTSFGEVSSEVNCSSEEYNEGDMFMTSICNLLDGRHFYFNRGHEMYSADTLSVELLDITDLSKLDYGVLDYFKEDMATLEKFLDGSYALDTFGQDERLVKAPINAAVTHVMYPTGLYTDGELSGIAFYHLEGQDTPGNPVYQAVFKVPGSHVVGFFRYFPPTPQGEKTWFEYFQQEVGYDKVNDDNYQELVGLAFQAYLDAYIKDDAAMKSMSTDIASFATSFAVAELSDVMKSHKYHTAISHVKDLGIVQGYSDGTYRPEQAINRAEFLKILIEAKYEDTDFAPYQNSHCFPDVAGGEWYTPYVCFAKERGIIQGYPDGTFGPGSTINLAESLKIIVETYDIMSPEYSEPPTNWYTPYVDAAIGKEMLDTINREVAHMITRGEMAELIYKVDTTQ